MRDIAASRTGGALEKLVLRLVGIRTRMQLGGFVVLSTFAVGRPTAAQKEEAQRRSMCRDSFHAGTKGLSVGAVHEEMLQGAKGLKEVVKRLVSALYLEIKVLYEGKTRHVHPRGQPGGTDTL